MANFFCRIISPLFIGVSLLWVFGEAAAPEIGFAENLWQVSAADKSVILTFQIEQHGFLYMLQFLQLWFILDTSPLLKYMVYNTNISASNI